MNRLGTPAQIIVSIAVIAFMIWMVIGSRKKRVVRVAPLPPDSDPPWVISCGRYRLRGIGPWPSTSGVRVYVIDMQGSWVRWCYYSREPTPDFERYYGDERSRLEYFERLFEPIDKDEI
jgi:hypothetical protein